MNVALAILTVVTVAAIASAIRSYEQASRARLTLEQIDRIDPLTGLANRNQLRTWLDALLKESRRSTSRVAVLAIEIDRFDYLNQTYGHEVGDALMLAAAKALQNATERKDLLVRYGGPQFVMAMPDVADANIARQRAESVVGALQHPLQVGSDRVRLSANVGVALSDQQHTRPDELLLDAEVALQHARANGRGHVSVFDTSMRSLFIPSAAEHRLRTALEREEFWLLYLPVVRLSDSRVVGAEALLRWADPEAGLVSPSHFLRSLDETGLIVPVGAWVLDQACRQARAWQEEFPGAPLEVTVNVSPRQLMQSDFVDTVTAAIASTQVDPSGLCLEITEGALMHDVDEMWATLRQIKALGVRLALDDFGTGTSSLSYVRRFQLDSMKIDKMFVEGVVNGREDRAIVEQLVGLAHALGIRAVAEGVETLDQVTALRSLGCDQAQGFYFSTPQPHDVIEQLLAQGRLDNTDRPEPSDGGGPLQRRGTVVPRDVAP